MTQFFFALLTSFTDIFRAAWHMLTRQKQARYSASGIVAAPIAKVWELVRRKDITFVANGLRVVAEPLPGHDGVLIARMVLNNREMPYLAYRDELVEPETRVVSRYLKDLSHPNLAAGSDDVVTIELQSVDATQTRVTYHRDIKHDSAASRISAPMGVRSGLYMVKAQAEHESGVAPARQPMWHQLMWTVLAFASFAWLLGWRTALLVMAIIAVHELGHALAMLRYGLGLNFVSFIPFLGGVASPKRPYANEWQRGIVALMGVGFSLPFVIALTWLSHVNHAQDAAVAAIFFAIINAVNLVPFPALDGSIVVSMLLRKVHPKLSLAVTILMFGAFVAVGIMINDAFVWAAVAFSFISVVQVMSLKIDEHYTPMRWPASLAMLALYLGLCGGYAAAGYAAIKVSAEAQVAQMTACLKSNPRNREACRPRESFWLSP